MSTAIMLIIWNVVVFLVYGIDKYKSQHKQWRIPENTLILFAFMFGGYGAWAGMKIFRHKTQHANFRWFVPVAVIIETAILAVALAI